MNYKVNPENLGLNPVEAEQAARELNRYLANLQVMFIKLHNLHWNVVGMSFFAIHEKTDELYHYVGDEIDRIAERIKMIGFYPVGSLSEALRLATITELPSTMDYNGPTVANIVIKDLQTLIRQLRAINEKVDSAYTGGLTGNSIEFFEKQHWMLSAYLTNLE
ncbi:Dps family protein [Fervidibacillus halotolerans]|uniref:DNA starvation/stationary phase protection protein n=1 Tax=Fervidibacillus halotolerans TaxID=2980027 RepID=A0A9E8M1F2_9BACI|nr:DNA starvation/stationary phase protection protein [Fervidibacillus halotolerans]WAA13416.1 DNA starvation/stationary phase protection protein [Fervidibacillus halotolerans]